MLFFIIFSFLLTLALLSKSFDLLAGRGLGNTIKNSPFLQNPITSTIIGMLISSVLQSSSTLISLLVGMVSGQILTVHQAIPIMIGAELGSSLMNVLVSIGQVGNREHFRRAFACATMNDAFNVMNYLTVLPLEITLAPLGKSCFTYSRKFVERISGMIVQPLSHVHTKEFKTIQLLTEPILDKVVQIDSAAITRVSAISASGNKTALSMIDRKTFIYRCIDMETYETLPFCKFIGVA
jgi:sodium-dependent phosphate cotransporter